MDLFEYQTKQLFRKAGLAVPAGEVADTPEEARLHAERFGPRVAVKAQVLTGGRMKAGGIRIVSSPDEAAQAARKILGMDIRGHVVHRVLVEECSQIAQEIYLAAMLDRDAQRLMMMASASGGIEIEEVAVRTPDLIRRIHPHPFLGLRSFEALQLAKDLGIAGTLRPSFVEVCQQLFQVLTENDAELAEINPLIVDDGERFVALDGKMTVDDNALPRQAHLASAHALPGDNSLEERARAAGLNFVHLGGDVACMGNGAGLAMATMDAIKHFGGRPANFLDIGGGATVEQVTIALQIMAGDPQVRSLLVNVSGGITRCDEVAEGMRAAIVEGGMDVPYVTRLVGTNEEEAREILAPFNVSFAHSFTDAAKKAVQLARENS